MEGNPKTVKNEVPFAENLKESEFSRFANGRINELENHPNKIVRIDHSQFHFETNTAIESAMHSEKLFRELETNYGVLVPAHFLVGKNETGDPVVYSVVDKINGKNLAKIERSDEIVAQTEILYTSLAKYLLDKSGEENSFLSDLSKPEQYVYGKRNGKEEDKIYLVDTDGYSKNDIASMYLAVEELLVNIQYLEERFQTKFEKAREYVSQIVKQPLPEEMDPYEKYEISMRIDSINKLLNN